MKKLIFLFLITFLFSCEKEERKICWICEIRQTATITVIQHYCNKTAEEIKEIEQKNTFYHNFDGVWWHQTMVCK